jgi:hypothetical protein
MLIALAASIMRLIGKSSLQGAFGLDSKDLYKANKRAYDDLSKSETGASAVAGARASQELKKAKTPSTTVRAYRESQYAGGKGGELIAQETRQIAGKSFYRNGTEWIDSEAQALKEAVPVEIEFGSNRYFELLEQSAEVAQWLSVGDTLQVVIDGKLYKIVAAE